MIVLISDIDECDKVNGPFGRCGGNSLCTNTPGGYGCQCKPGFTGNAFKQCTGTDVLNVKKTTH